MRVFVVFVGLAALMMYLAIVSVFTRKTGTDGFHFQQRAYTSLKDSYDIKVTLPSAQYTIPQRTFVAQSFNNCGPASLSMLLSLYGKDVSQEELASQIRPFHNPIGGIDDKSVFAPEMVEYAKKNGFFGLDRPNGSIPMLKMFLANDVPVIVRTWLNDHEDIGHFRVVRGYDDIARTVTVDDSYNGPNMTVSYDDFNNLWQPFNYGYIVIYPIEKEEIVAKIVGKEMDERVAWENALSRAKRESENTTSPYPAFNIAIAQYHLGNYQETAKVYEEISQSLPSRMLWYQLEPIYAYQKLKQYDNAIALADSILYNGNLAFSELYQLKGEIYQEQGRAEEARDAFQTAFYYNENFVTAKRALERLET